MNSPRPNALLGGIFTEYMTNTEGLLAPVMFPLNTVSEEAGTYYIWDKENNLSIPVLTPRGDDDAFQQADTKAKQTTYGTYDYAVEVPVPDKVRRRYANYFNADMMAMRRASSIILVNRERRAKTLADTITANSSPSTKWDAANSTPVKDVKTAKRVVRQACGLQPNTLALSEQVFDVLCENSDIRDRLKYTQTDIVSEMDLARIFKIARVVVAQGAQNTANAGQTISVSDIWGEDCYLFYTSLVNDIQEMSMGKNMCWDAFSTADPNNPQILTWREEARERDVHRAREYCAEKLTADHCGYRLTNTLT